MTRMTKAISLALISSSLILAGCARKPPPTKETDKDKEELTADGKPTHVRSGTHYHPWYYGWGSPWGYSGSSRRAGVSTTRSGGSSSFHSGGFGSTGHAAGT